MCLVSSHAEKTFVDGSCSHCKYMTMVTSLSRLSFLVRKAATSAVDPSGIHKAETAGAEGNMRATTGVFLPCPHFSACPVLPALCALQMSLMLLHKMHLISHSGHLMRMD